MLTDERRAETGADCCTPDQRTARWPHLAEDARLLKALADETRLGIVLQLREQGDVCQCDLVACCDLAQPTVSHHMRVLRQAGIVTATRRGVWMHYQLNSAVLERLRRYLA